MSLCNEYFCFFLSSFFFIVIVIYLHHSNTIQQIPYKTLPAFPTCIISPVLCSSLLSVGQLAPSAFANVTSSFVPRILKLEAAVSIGPYSGTDVLYRLGGVSVVTRLRSREEGWKTTNAVSFCIFLRKKDTISVVGVW